MKYRLIAGTINDYAPEPGWVNIHLDVSNRPIWHGGLQFAVQPDVVADIGSNASMAQFRGAMFDEVRAHHVLEHLAYPRALNALSHFERILKPDGILDIEVPDLLRVVRAWLNDEINHDDAMQWLYGEQLGIHEPGDSHRFGWTEPLLRDALETRGFAAGDRLETGLALRFRAQRKP